MPQLDISTLPTQVFWLVVHFAVLYYVMIRIALPRIGQVLESREERISADLEKARALQKEAEYVQAEFRRSQLESRTKSKKIIDDIREDVTAAIHKKQQELNSTLAEKVTQAEARIQTARNNAFAEMKEAVLSVSDSSYTHLTGKKIPAAELQKTVELTLNKHGI